MTLTAYAEQQAWVGIDCTSCGCRYSCRVQATGSASNTLLPFGSDTLKEMALHDLDVRLRMQAEAIPCPECGAYPEGHVERSVGCVGRALVWALSVGLFFLFVALIARLGPRSTPVWVVLPLALGTWIGSRFIWSSLAPGFSPNRNLEQNRTVAQSLLLQGRLQVQSPPPTAP